MKHKSFQSLIENNKSPRNEMNWVLPQDRFPLFLLLTINLYMFHNNNKSFRWKEDEEEEKN